ncbi:hypothetical protein Kpol_1063p15 [Vanderwaltozyma polyspora DSM 70294]|uniref:BHLH domain-containing protein n=1 Tax=Vanderwaltozyma polyspora (strain ATCC 22028 / DSM 70294 / BCRC 21397 / CBS 2163 / NBRC 10782 / NRRL Y-8283 / UCD 57-17) TaxID=436907 RepID=A7TQQ9_VANPO|nr:uncharacterized protein Kpol_1063p15 [Vanderwaltozyma polyspora DSM 70294]EDO15404.1 hypothetical protein Kpol_1063p15 [Vanderwaltozyma polyspora DSM 70294]
MTSKQSQELMFDIEATSQSILDQVDAYLQEAHFKHSSNISHVTHDTNGDRSSHTATPHDDEIINDSYEKNDSIVANTFNDSGNNSNRNNNNNNLHQQQQQHHHHHNHMTIPGSGPGYVSGSGSGSESIKAKSWSPKETTNVYLDSNEYNLLNHEHVNKNNQDVGYITNDMIFSPVIIPNQANGNSTNNNQSLHVSPYMNPMAPRSSSYNANSGLVDMNANTPFLRANNRKNSGATGIRRKHSNGNFSPLTSPAMTPLSSGKVVKSSPRISGMNSTSNSRRSYVEQLRNNTVKENLDNGNSTENANGWEDFLFKLPDSSIGNDNTDFLDLKVENSMKPTSLVADYPKVILPSHSNNSQEDGLKENKHDDNNNYKNDINSNGNHIRSNIDIPGQEIIDYPISNRLSKHDLNDENANDNDDNMRNDSGTGKVLRATESPVIRPRASHITNWKTRKLSQTKTDINNIKGNINNRNSTISGSSSSSNISTISADKKGHKGSLSNEFESEDAFVDNENGLTKVKTKEEEDIIKKNVHKVAEQGRRNRLNNALNDLKLLIPKELRDTVEIPSKATTVELACKYIRQLLADREGG